MRNLKLLAASGVALALASLGANATDALAAVASAVDFTSVEADIATIAVAVVGVLIIMRGARFLFSIVRR